MGPQGKQQHSCSYLVECGANNRIRFAGDAAAQKSGQVFLCSSINWKYWSWGEKTKQMRTAHLFLLILCPFLLQKKLLLLYSSFRTENIWNYTANAKLWLKSLFFPAHGMTSNGFFFHLNKWVVKITSLPKMCVRLVASSALRAGKDTESWDRQDADSDCVPNEYIYLFQEFPTWLYVECSTTNREMLSFSVFFKLLSLHAG